MIVVTETLSSQPTLLTTSAQMPVVTTTDGTIADASVASVETSSASRRDIVSGIGARARSGKQHRSNRHHQPASANPLTSSWTYGCFDRHECLPYAPMQVWKSTAGALVSPQVLRMRIRIGHSIGAGSTNHRRSRSEASAPAPSPRCPRLVSALPRPSTSGALRLDSRVDGLAHASSTGAARPPCCGCSAGCSPRT